ncbi:MAG TPA: GIY-YIG nuclease family protein [Armatimonadota bacterium]|nr:GIY-YIG nuclease family protein [Armatimonadota bacterium]
MTERRTPGVYHLVLRLRRARTIEVGRLGRFEFGAGYYVYTGSAMGGLEARLARHRRQRKKLWWHIDYLLRQAELVDVVAVPTQRREECERNRWVLSLPGAGVVAPGFGASDCRCASHLAYFGGRRPELAS